MDIERYKQLVTNGENALERARASTEINIIIPNYETAISNLERAAFGSNNGQDALLKAVEVHFEVGNLYRDI